MAAHPVPSRAAAIAASLSVAAILSAAAPLPAQVLVGRVLDEYTSAPVATVEVALHEADGKRLRAVESDSLGRYRLELPRGGAFVLATTRIGYEGGRTPLLDLSFDGVRTLDLMVTPTPVALRGFEVTVSAEEALERELRSFGIVPGQIPRSRIVTKAEIESIVAADDFADVLGRQNVAGIRIQRMDPLPKVCVKMGDGWSSGCAVLVVDGLVTPSRGLIQQAMLIPPEGIEAIVVLKPSEATLLFGTAGGNGAVLIFTRTLRARRP